MDGLINKITEITTTINGKIDGWKNDYFVYENQSISQKLPLKSNDYPPKSTYKTVSL